MDVVDDDEEEEDDMCRAGTRGPDEGLHGRNADDGADRMAPISRNVNLKDDMVFSFC